MCSVGILAVVVVVILCVIVVALSSSLRIQRPHFAGSYLSIHVAGSYLPINVLTLCVCVLFCVLFTSNQSVVDVEGILKEENCPKNYASSSANSTVYIVYMFNITAGSIESIAFPNT